MKGGRRAGCVSRTEKPHAETRRRGEMKGGNGESVANEVTLRRAEALRTALKTSRGDAEARRKFAKL